MVLQRGPLRAARPQLATGSSMASHFEPKAAVYGDRARAAILWRPRPKTSRQLCYARGMLAQNVANLVDHAVGMAPFRAQTAHTERARERPRTANTTGARAAVAERDPQRRPLNVDSMAQNARGAPPGPTMEDDADHLNVVGENAPSTPTLNAVDSSGSAQMMAPSCALEPECRNKMSSRYLTRAGAPRNSRKAR